eukprot:Gb_06412 [translate_table: standard]
MALHVLVIPYPLQGHITPLLHLSEKLAAKGILLTFVNTQHNHLKILKARSGHEITFNPAFHIRLAQISDNLPLDFDRSAHRSEFYEAVKNMGPALEHLIYELNTKTDPPVSSIIASSFLPWTYDVANKFDLQWIFFWSESVTCFAIYNHLSDIISNGHFPPKKTEEMIDYIPGLPPLEPKDLPSQIQDGDSASLMHQSLSTQFELVSKADWVIGNTVDDLENDALIQVKTPICSVGPLFHSACFDELNSYEKNTLSKTSLRAESNCSPWLDSKPSSSVVYISFGSMIQMSQTQVQEIAMGLLESQQLFLWVVRPDIVSFDGSDVFPEGFLEKTRDQGVVVPWCSQVSVLSHPAIGGFFTHGGWNSTMESLSLGVPMLVFPQWYDQYTNRMLIVKQWKVGIELEDHRNEGINVDRGEISRAVKALIIGEEGKILKKNANELKEKIRGAVSQGGSSVKNLESFVKFLARKK